MSTTRVYSNHGLACHNTQTWVRIEISLRRGVTIITNPIKARLTIRMVCQWLIIDGSGPQQWKSWWVWSASDIFQNVIKSENQATSCQPWYWSSSISVVQKTKKFWSKIHQSRSWRYRHYWLGTQGSLFFRVQRFRPQTTITVSLHY